MGLRGKRVGTRASSFSRCRLFRATAILNTFLRRFKSPSHTLGEAGSIVTFSLSRLGCAVMSDDESQ
jgi:hypothetical protein